jgi:hypothetical protein
MTRARAIKQFCHDCSGESSLTVTLCCSFECFLWPWRLGVSISSKVYQVRVEKALRNHQDYVRDLSEVGVDVIRFSLKHAISAQGKGERDLGKGVAGRAKDRPKALESIANFEEGGSR